MTDIAIRVDNLSKLYHLGALQQRHDTLRDALTGFMPRIARIARRSEDNSPNSRNSRQASGPDELWALKDVSFEACPEFLRRIKRGEVMGTPAFASNVDIVAVVWRKTDAAAPLDPEEGYRQICRMAVKHCLERYPQLSWINYKAPGNLRQALRPRELSSLDRSADRGRIVVCLRLASWQADVPQDLDE